MNQNQPLRISISGRRRSTFRKVSAALLFLALPAFLFSDGSPKPLNAFNGEDWCAWTPQIRYVFMMGFFTGSYTVQQGAGNMGFLDASEVDALQLVLPRATTITTVVQELNSFYASEDHRIPLTVAVVLRNNRNLPPWETLSATWHGWSYKEPKHGAK